jgi:hypothetical protein
MRPSEIDPATFTVGFYFTGAASIPFSVSVKHFGFTFLRPAM